MKRSALPFFAASMADRSASAAPRLRRDSSSSSFVIYRQAEYHRHWTGRDLKRLAHRSLANTWIPGRDVFVDRRTRSGLISPVRGLLCGPVMIGDLRFAWRALW